MRERLITIDINKVNFKILKYKQFDNNNILKVEIIEKGKLIDLSGYSAYFFFKLPSGEILQKNTTIEDNKIKVFLDSGVFSESGRVKVEITLSNAEQIVTTFTMYFEIEETIDRNEAIQSKPEWDIISDILNGTGGTGGTGGSIDISNKVDKEEGKGLISLSEIERLANVDNYDDTEIRELIKEKADKEDLHEHENKDILDEITEEKIEQWNKGGFSGDYNDLINKPTIPSIEGLATESYVKNEIANAQLDGGDVDLSGYATKDDLHEHTNKNILDNITSEKVNDWDNKSEFDGDYNSLTNKPTIPSIEGLATKDYVENEINKKINVDLISNPISGTVLTLTNDRYQMAEIVDGTTIVLPVVETYTEIHLFFTTTSDITIIMPNGIKYQKIPTIIADKTYEFIFTYTNVGINWVFGYIEYIN